MPPRSSRRPNTELPTPRVDWHQAACRGEDQELFFGPDGERRREKDIREGEARAICARCPIRSDCLNYAIGGPESYGFWGGLNPDQRAAERRRRQRVAIAAAKRAS